MKKSGFTLAELLIALGIVGVISALLATALLTLQPDQQKAIYLKNYDALSKAVKELAHNDRLFPICQDNLNCQEHPLFNTSSGVGGRFVAIGEGNGKLCRGLSYVFNGQMLPNLNCDNQPLTYEDGDWTPSFRTYRTEWLVSTLRELSGSSATYQSDVYFDLNGPAAPNCVYGDNCKNPDRFKFLVAANGTVIPADPIGQEYIKTRKNWRKSNLNISEDRSTKETLLADLRSFTLNPCASESGGDGDSKDNSGIEWIQVPITCNFTNVVSGNNSENIVLEMPTTITCDSPMPWDVTFHSDRYFSSIVGFPTKSVMNEFIEKEYLGANKKSFYDTKLAEGECTIPKDEYSCKEDMTYYFNYKPVILFTGDSSLSEAVYLPFVLYATYSTGATREAYAYPRFSEIYSDHRAIDFHFIDKTEGLSNGNTSRILGPYFPSVDAMCKYDYYDMRINKKVTFAELYGIKCPKWYE